MTKIIHFHFDTSDNIGDAAVVHSIKNLLYQNLVIEKYTEHPIYYLSNINFYNFFQEKLSKKTIFYKLHISHLAILLLVFLVKIGKCIKGVNKNKLISQINKHDLMIIGGGGVYSKWTLPFDIDLIERINVPIVIFGAGFNRNYTDKELTPSEKQSIRILNDRAKILSVRDEKTLELVKMLGYTNAKLIGDPAIHLQSRYNNIFFKQETLKIGLNISCQEKHTKNKASKVIEIYIKLIKFLQKTHNIEVYYLMHSKDEIQASNELKNAIPNLHICNYDANEMKYIYENLNLVIAMMLHSTIFSYSSDVDFINVAYDVKNYAFMKLINNEDNLIDIKELNYCLLRNKCLKILKDKKKKKKLINIQYFNQKIDKFMNEIKFLTVI